MREGGRGGEEIPASEEEIRATIAAILPPRDRDTVRTVLGAGSDDVETSRSYLRRAAGGGWVVPTWPRAHGGRGAGRAEAALVARVLREFAVPDLYPVLVGLHLVGPTLRTEATAAQQDRWLRRIADGSDVWCQLFSEPEAGSDLANAATRAERDGDGWVLTGQKVWTSRGSYADWGICLARTNPDLSKHKGLTMFAVRMSAPGVEVRPLVQMNGDRHFSEVFLTAVPVGDSDRIGAVGQGWRVARTVLAHERTAGQRSAAGRPADRDWLPAWLAQLRRDGRLGEPALRDRAVRLYAEEQVNRWTAARAAAAARSGTPGPEGSGRKLMGSRIYQLRADLLIDAHGAAAMLSDGPHQVEFLTAPSMSIRGGTDEIQRNIIAERVLGLPPEPRVDTDIPWSVSRKRNAGDSA